MNLKYLITKRFKNWFIYVLVKSIFSFLQVIPRWLAFGLLTNIAGLCYWVIPAPRQKTIRHLTGVFGKSLDPAAIRKMARQVYWNLGRNAVDMFRLKQVVGQDPYRYVQLSGKENLDQALAKSKGVIVITGHIGCWELMAGFIAAIGYQVAVVGKPLYDPRIDQMLVANRTAVGLKNIVRDQGARQILTTLHAGQIVGILIDQDTKVDGVFVNFLGQPAFTPVGPVTLALKTGAAIVPMSIHIQADHRHLVEIEPAIELDNTGDKIQDRLVNTEKCSQAIEHMLMKDPTQWVWMHERWKTKPKP
ncbi:lysophospholipid acyltransferase family protein [candidate division KSB1 bacterium]|nr:lysophospholipid acyltransferase family protein [candidate division KSB1 bacterium]